MTDKTDITLTINGRDHAIRVEPRRTLADAIREDCGQTGTHIGCEHGICGACTVIVDGEPVRSCLMFAVQADGKKIRTVEGLAKGDELHPMQRAFMEHHGLQCGFCTPGFLMLAVGVLEREPDISDEDLLDVLSSNLCRCTGYQNIVKAVRAAAKEMRGKVTAAGEFVGRSVPRLEDRPLLTGQGRFAADISFPGQWHMRVVRSPVAHGKHQVDRRERGAGAARRARGVDRRRRRAHSADPVSPHRPQEPRALSAAGAGARRRALCRRAGRRGVRRRSICRRRRRRSGRARHRARRRRCSMPTRRSANSSEG